METEDGQSPHPLPIAISVGGKDDPKPETLPVLYLQRPTLLWPNLGWLIFFQVLKYKLSSIFYSG